MMESAYRHNGLDVRYINCEVSPEALPDAVRGARAMGWIGFNCSIPHKVAVIDHLDGLGESASIIGAVNCVVRRGDHLRGENTDGQGFLTALETISSPTGKHVVIFGAGGAARAVAVELALAGASSITIVNRDQARGTELVQLLNDKTSTEATFAPWNQHAYEVPQHMSIVVNATSIGLHPNTGAEINLDTDTLMPKMIVADVIPNPPRTRLIRAAEDRGCTVLDGLGMLVNQATISIKHWTGVDADPAVMRRTLEHVLTQSA
jgi:shikimate dehydrogenase